MDRPERRSVVATAARNVWQVEQRLQTVCRMVR